MSEAVQIRISQYGVVATATVTRAQLTLGFEQLIELAQELHRDAVWACLQKMGSDAALSWRQILGNLEAARDEMASGRPAPRSRESSAKADSAAMSMASFENAE